MSGEWSYRTLTAELSEIESADGRPAHDWIVTFSDARWVGWHQILGTLGNEGWEIFSVVVEEQGIFPSGQLSGHVSAYRLFCRKPKEENP